MDEQWNGEGLPPIGFKCEYTATGWLSWVVVTVLAYGVSRHFVKEEGEPFERLVNAEGVRFRLIRTAESIAAEVRLEAITSMEADAGISGSAFDGDPEARVWIENLIDKGWHKKVAP